MQTAEFLEMSAAVVPDRVALICGARSLTYAETRKDVARLANALRGLGMRRGDRLGVLAVNSAESVITYYACAAIGITFVPINYRAKPDELRYMIDTAELKALFIADRYQELVQEIRTSIPSVKHYVSLESPQPGQLYYPALLERADDDFIVSAVDDDDPTILTFTSGTTALAKGVLVTYQDMTVYVANTMPPADPGSAHDTTLLSVPLFHIAGLTAMLSSIWGGRSLVILPQFSPEEWMQAVDLYSVTHSMVVPTMLQRILDHPGFSRFHGRSLKLLAYGAAPASYELIRRSIEAFDCGLMNAYGQTESTSAIAFLGPDDHRLEGSPAEIAQKELRLRSVGRVMDDMDLTIRDSSDRVLSSGEEGEICVRSARIMKGYYKQDDATQAAIRDGWLHTGDVGHVDRGGYLFITGRATDLIIRGGENIAPGEVERILEEHPSVTEAAVIGVPDTEWGEVVKAVVMPPSGATPSLEELREHCRQRLASYKAPQYLATVSELPRNFLGKVLKNDLRKLHGQPDNH